MNGGKLWKVLTSLGAALSSAAVVGGIVMYGDVRVVKANDEKEAAHEANQDRILATIPKIEGAVVSIDKTLKRIEDKLDAIEKAEKEMAVENAKHHHTHGRGDRDQ